MMIPMVRITKRHAKIFVGRIYRATFVAMLACLGNSVAETATAEQLQLHTNQTYLEDVTKPASLPIADRKAMFAFVLGSLPGRVKVYPTENYYYFRFYENGMPFAGNIRLAAADRDQGKLHFAYFPEWAEWRSGDDEMNYVVLGPEDGVVIERLEPLVYRVTFEATSVIFALNDLSTVSPPPGTLGPDEIFLGPVFDESAIRFFLIFNTKRKMFHYVLDETVRVPDELVPGRLTNRVLIGKRTGFAFYRDRYFDRKILIGTYQANTIVNNYFDGPFDQLPDNFLKSDELRAAILQVDPSLAGQIDRFGVWFEGGARYLIGPYTDYRSEEDLDFMHQCAITEGLPFEWYHACFVADGSGFADYPRPEPESPKQSGRAVPTKKKSPGKKQR